MARDPYIQFDTRAWISDPQLRMASRSTRGIWIDMLCYMRTTPQPGVLHGKIEDLMSLTGSTEEEITLFINDARFHKFCDVTICHDIVTVTNRRMLREAKQKEASRVRQQKHREKKTDNADVTVSTVVVEVIKDNVTDKKQEKNKINYCWERHGFNNVTKSLLDKWAATYPALNIEVEIRKAEAWVHANPKNTKGNWERFLVNWLARAQDKAPPIRNGTPIPKASKFTQRCGKCDELVEDTVDRRGMKVCITCYRAMDPALDREALNKLNNFMPGSTCQPSH